MNRDDSAIKIYDLPIAFLQVTTGGGNPLALQGILTACPETIDVSAGAYSQAGGTKELKKKY